MKSITMNIIIGIQMILVLKIIKETIVQHSNTSMHVTAKTFNALVVH